MSESRILIIEDEPPAVNRLSKMLHKLDPGINIVDIIDSVETAIKYLNYNNSLDLIFMDIQLSDGLSFEIFSEIDLNTPVIFTTAYDQYMLNAFKVHSVDYLLKPIEVDELTRAYNKFNNYFNTQKNNQQTDFSGLIDQLTQKSYKERFLVKTASELKYVPISDIAYFYSEDGYSHICTSNKSKYIIDYKLDELDKLVNPSDFFRISRQMVVNIGSIKKIESYFNSRLKLSLNPQHSREVIVSRDRCNDFKSWLDR